MNTFSPRLTYSRIQTSESDSSASPPLPCTSAGQGLTPEEVLKSRALHGKNALSAKKRSSFGKKFISNLGDPIIRILLIALGLNLLFSLQGGTDWIETCGIALAVFMATLISTLSECGSEAAFARLSEISGHICCRVIRRKHLQDAGVLCEIPIEEIVVGDIIALESGEMIPADGVLVSGNMRVDQSSMTGESREIEKRASSAVESDINPEHPSGLFRGCTVRSGEGLMQVLAVGDSTLLGQISEEVQVDTRESPLKRRLTHLAKQISFLGYVAAALVGIIYLINAFVFDSGFDTAAMLGKLTDFHYAWPTLFSALTLGLTVLVVAVPEGLPMMIAVVLSSNIKKMVKDQVLVRKPVGIESAGSMNLLFTDKTGTLTQGKLSVSEIITGWGEGYTSLSKLKKSTPLIYRELLISCHLNTSATIGMSGESRCALGGNATDRALLSFAASTHCPDGYTVRDKLSFNSDRKASVAYLVFRGQPFVYVKGAAERLLPYVTHTLNHAGEKVAVDRRILGDTIRQRAATGDRLILIARNDTRIPTVSQCESGYFGALTLVCIAVLKDQLRPEAKESVKKLQRAGVHVVMVTGDGKETARAIAEASGILHRKNDLVLDSADLFCMNDQELKDALPRIAVIARALPSDKSRLVRVAQDSGWVVGMTGDGINDAPALKRADVGFAMGSGTQVAKDAGDIIILDDNLSSVCRAVLYGRTVFKSIRKFITLQLTMNLSAMAVSMICPFIGIDAPVTVVQMLWINLIMDTLGGLAFAGEAPLASYMEEPPKKPDEPILNRYMFHQITWLGGFTVALCLAFFKLPFIRDAFRSAPDDIYVLTAFFALFIFSSVFNCFNCRTDRLRLFAGLARNKGFSFIMVAVLTVQLIFVYLGGSVLRTAPLLPSEMWLTSCLSLLVFPAETLRKIMWRLKGGHEGF